ncbi:glycosyltransferase [Leptolyngbya boryana CZ1]|uniref:Glycosyltransferase n=1 Tax=Leptolyngbya boryana CZ1 TaxID=3060204 RepID=A0AA96WSF2_LEPBY|nr:glycosyltransferase [Leptolyngbya boryana]WNZ43379.1 glycosyltransferase [Leptolyngbya boryana CZ1]
MKILHIIPSVSLIRGGPSHAVLEMVWELRQQGIDAVIATTNDDGDGLLQVPFNQWIDYPISATEADKTVPVQFFSRFSPALTSIREFTFSFSLTLWLWQHIREYDLLHIHAVFSYPSAIAMKIANLAKVPYIIRPLGSLAQWSLQQGAQKKQLYLRLIQQEIQQANALHFTSTQEQQEATASGLAFSSFVLPHGLTLPPSRPDAKTQLRDWLNLPAEDPVILFLSRLHPKKGLDALIAALGQLSNQRFQFVVAGRGTPEYEAELHQQLQAARIQDRTHCVGFVSGDRKHLLLQGSDLFALPSHSENFGIAVLEAMAAGLPVLITPEVALADLVHSEQLGWVASQSPSELAHAIQTCLTTPRIAQSMGERAGQLVRSQFTWQSTIQQLIHHYQTFVQPSSIPASSTMLDAITPVILTYNEADNIDRTLQRLKWAKRIIVVDSYSQDETLQILAKYPQVELFQRSFDTHANQWNYGLEQVQTEWVLSLDADYCLSEELTAEMAALSTDSEFDSYFLPFKYCVFGKPLRKTLLPPREALFRKSKAVYVDDGHTQLLKAEGCSSVLNGPIYHDDRKSFSRWLWAQDRYALLEVQKLLTTPQSDLSFGDRIRQTKVLAPLVVLLYCLILHQGLFDGWRGWFYAFQRVLAEMILSARLIEASYRRNTIQTTNEPVLTRPLESTS